MTAKQYLQDVRERFAAHADAENAREMSRYMRDQFLFFGIKSPLRKELGRQLIADLGVPQGEELKDLCRLGFRAEEREVHYFVSELLAREKRRLDATFLDLTEELIQRRSWWDTVDILAPRVAGSLLLRFPEARVNYPDQWVKADNLWLRRAALIYQLSYKEKTDAERLFRYVRQTAESDEFFVEKAAGWALRQYSKTDAAAVRRFIDETELPALTVREGLKWLRNADKKRR